MKAENIQLGIAPIGWTNDDLPELGAENTFEQCVSEMALAGYTGCEVGNKYPRDVAVLNTNWTCVAFKSVMRGSAPSLWTVNGKRPLPSSSNIVISCMQWGQK